MNVRHWTALHFGEPPLSTECDWYTCTSVLGQYSGKTQNSDAVSFTMSFSASIVLFFKTN